MKKIIVLVWSAFFIVTMGAGCTQANKKPVVPEPKPNTAIDQNASLSASEKRVMASRFSTIADNIEGVKSATVVVDTGNTSGTIATPNEIERTNNKSVNTQSPDIRDSKVRTGDNTGKTAPAEPGAPINPRASVSRNNNIIAMVGVTLDDMSKEAMIKKNIKQQIMDSDKRVSEVLVTSDPNMIKKIRDVASGVLEGKPTSSYAKDVNELNTMIKRQ